MGVSLSDGPATSDSPRPSLLDPAHRPVSLGTTALISLFAVEYIAVGTAMPTVARALDGLGLYALAFSATIAASVIGMILGGWWSDKSGPRAVLVVGATVFAGGLLGAGLSTSMELFVAARALQGLGSGMAIVAIYVVIAQGIPDLLRPRMFSLLAAAWVVPGLVGPVLTGFLVDQVGWRWVFLGVIPLVVVSMAVLLPALGRTEPSEDAPYLGVSTILWAVLAAVSVGVLNLGGEHISVQDVLIGLPFAVALGVAAWRLLPPGTLTLGRGLPSVIAARGAIGASFMAAEAYLPLMLQDLHGYSPTEAGLALAVGAVTWAGGSWLQGRLRDTVDRVRVMVVGCTIITVGTGLLVAAIVTDWPGWTVLVIWGITQTGVGVAYPTTSLQTMRLSAPQVLGRNSSSLQVSEALASAVVLGAVGAVFTALYAASMQSAFAAVAIASVAAALAAVATSARSRPA
ncbi:MFS transporter [Ornithinimicrobium ciconiae]|uniref:MFS transporter n=1 Tax=Ornithinimicrobium ciconiae TaxID=2594265 RepID=A0A516GBY6_9MICO|nr:MFS transporter [Ornithinimicrobium ciconiae]